MFSEILARTPIWVYGVFVGLVFLGYYQSKDKLLEHNKIFILPIIMVIYSCTSLFSTFGAQLSAILCFNVAIMLIAWNGRQLDMIKNSIFYLPETNTFLFKGSWVWLGLIMAIFFTKYTVNVLIARQADVIGDPSFINLISALYGAFTGLFLARVILATQLRDFALKNPS